ncbi:hypothetical protein WJ970_16490 [Achromobacter xylosoxidans]
MEDLLRGCAPLLIALSRRHRELRCPPNRHAPRPRAGLRGFH